MCTFVAKETIAHYLEDGGSVYCAMLDATKAFDRLEYCRLFKLLIDRGLPPICLRFLMNMYSCNLVCVAWHGITSPCFVARNGVKQGGILSPVLFCIYFDGLLLRLHESKFGCWVASVYAGALSYADDLVLFAPTPTAMRRMLDICDKYASEYRIDFNASKSRCIVFLFT
jgi:hypothetical protein